MRWKTLIGNCNKLPNIENKLIDFVKNNAKNCKYVYKLYLEKKKDHVINAQHKWEIDVNSVLDDWNNYYSMAFLVTKNSFLQNFQFKLLHRILPCNSFLYKCNLKETELCTFCSETKETLYHIFWECNVVKNFWLFIKNWLNELGILIPFNAKELIFGVNENHLYRNMINNVLLFLKYYIYKCRCKNINPCFNGGIEYLKYCIKIDKHSTYYLSPTQKEKIVKKWIPLDAVI